MTSNPDSQCELKKNKRPGSDEDGLCLFDDIKKKAEQFLKKEKKRIKNLQGDLSDCSQAGLLRKKGELLKVNLHLAKRGMNSISVKDAYSENLSENFTIELDPCRPAKEQVNAFFKKAQKYERGIDKIKFQITEAQKRISDIMEFVSRIEHSVSEGVNKETPSILLARAAELKLYSFPQSEEKKKNISKRQAEYNKLLRAVRKFKSNDGIDILVGKNNIDNDTLSFRIAKGNDWWFHVAPCPGSHVVVKNDGRSFLPQETLLDAASLAVYYSKMRDASQVDVHYTQVKFIRRIKGAPPGKVKLERNDSLRVRIENDRLDRIFSAKEKEHDL